MVHGGMVIMSGGWYGGDESVMRCSDGVGDGGDDMVFIVMVVMVVLVLSSFIVMVVGGAGMSCMVL